MNGGTIAEVRLFAGNFAPSSWAYCAGQLISISSNQALYSLIGTIYGGDGRATFGLPDLRSRTAIGQGTGIGLSQYNLGWKLGEEYVTLTSAEIPSHTHTVYASLTGYIHPLCSSDGVTDDPTSAYPALSPEGVTIYTKDTPDTTMAASPAVVSGSVTCLDSGSGQAHYNIQPCLGINYIICVEGLYPSRAN